jgi:hypothetical protein
VIERALNGPAELKSWVLARIEEAVRRDGRVDGHEAGLLRRTIFASGGDGALAVSKDEAELLWRLKDSCREADNAPEWKILFVQGVGNHLMAYNSYKPLERGEAARLEAFMDDRRSSVLGFFSRMRGANPVNEARGLLGGGDAPKVDHEAAVEEARAITGTAAPSRSAAGRGFRGRRWPSRNGGSRRSRYAPRAGSGAAPSGPDAGRPLSTLSTKAAFFWA